MGVVVVKFSVTVGWYSGFSGARYPSEKVPKPLEHILLVVVGGDSNGGLCGVELMLSVEIMTRVRPKMNISRIMAGVVPQDLTRDHTSSNLLVALFPSNCQLAQKRHSSPE